MKTDSVSNQLRWVILLLAAAVILPTVCLLWFMAQAMKNERLAVRGKYVDTYKKQFELSRQNHLDDDHVQLNLTLPQAGGILVFDSNDLLTFPVFADDSTVDNDAFHDAFAIEYQQRDFAKALSEYVRIFKNSSNNSIRIKAEISQARCLSELNRLDEAVKKLRMLLSDYPDEEIAVRNQKCRARILLLELYRKTKNPDFKDSVEQLYNNASHGMAADNDLQHIGEPDFLDKAIPTATQAFALTRFIEYANQLPPTQEIEKKIKRAERLISLLNQSLYVAQYYPKPDFVDTPTIVSNSVFRLQTKKPLYGRYWRPRKNYIRLSVFSQTYFASLTAPLLKDIETFPATGVIYDETGLSIIGAAAPKGQRPFITMPVSDWLPGWSAHLFVKETTFDNFAEKQAAIYLWLAILVIILILFCGGFVTKAVLSQNRMNRLKNDFIATVTHELKTPLASMRLLVDTLLEGNYEDQKTATEYLQLVANENKRLTHLIDSFLTFSRMERNKQVFDFQPTSPAEIANAAVEAMQAKLSSENCDFRCTFADNLPLVNADKDAMVTVLVNLLDNAYKYTNSDKQIELKVYEQNRNVCFSVTDNGIGMSPRAQKKIFNRFYQVDSRLSRRTEGCGLGLSIVKFIIDAHKGTIEVESSSCKGSIFTVKLSTS